ncbi:helix-turn-helix transcriptional regulator [Streptomyces hoynatensis]|uniref:XRE family transcriptional regulator n=1 Tax=Streptomyces hoynatensis TaxID=1141874 RepID=A0A3A9YWL9_9ACTN|nr:helix-turn-helix transcriptional regulator [Streptomyces hoynatensis]RKN40388.1 XRE family transcriptional regulator [Streptomyces hoynatensis]
MSASLGDRLREARKRAGLSQRELARHSGVSYSLITKIEQDERRDTRMETLHRLARVLDTTTTALLTEPAVDDPSADGHSTPPQWHGVQDALTDTATDVAEAPTLRGVQELAEAAVRAYRSTDYDALAVLLPGLIRDSHTLAEITPQGGPLRVRALTMAGRLMTQTRQYAVADTALSRAMHYAPDTPFAVAAVDLRCWLLLRRGRVEEVLELVAQWADQIEPRFPRATPTELSLYGWLLLRGAAAAGRDNRPDEAKGMLRLAEAAAVAAGRPHQLRQLGFIHTFSVSAVRMQRAEYAMVRDRPDDVLRLSAQVGVEQMSPTSGSRNRHLLDVANAQTRTRRYGPAVETLMSIYGNAPQWLPHQRYARDIVRSIVERRRTLTPEMRQLAGVVRLPL